MTTARQHVAIEGRTHDVLSLDDLETFAFHNSLTVTYPPAATGWATTRLGTHRWAAWFTGASERMPEDAS